MDANEEAQRPKPASILVPPRASMESVFTYGLGGLGFSPGPLTLVSNFFSEASPPGVPEIEGVNENDVDSGGGGGGYKRNRPASLEVAPPHNSLSQLLMIPSGMTPSGLLASPGFLSPLQSPFVMSHQQALAFVTAQAAFSDTQMQIQQQSSSPPSDDAFASITETETLKIESRDGSQHEIKAPAAGKAEVGNPGDDGYHWRKYGQKNVKARECPRSYYRCSYVDCPVRKKVETSIDGSVSEIIYKGEHNHEPPQASKRGKGHTQSKSLSSVCQFNTQHVSSGNKNESKEAEVVTIEEEGDLPDAKRRNVELEKPPPRTSTEYKIVVQTRSEVDLLDDGYRWRKYGQKIVKGKTHPRSYYKCTYPDCNVRKHVERATSDTRDVTTTYEGKHNHDIPNGRHSSHTDPHHVKPQKEAAQSSRGTNQIPATLFLNEEQIVA